MFIIGGTLLALFLVGTFWDYIREYFLNGALRDLMARIFGAEKIGWYINFIIWMDNTTTAGIRLAESWYERFRCNVLKVDSTYSPSSTRGCYVNRRESIVAIDNERARRVITEETIPYRELPAQVRHEMIRQRTESARLDEREVVCRRFEEEKKKIELATAG